MRLSQFIRENLETILQQWEDFACSIQPPHRTMDRAELRDHAEEMLRGIAADLEQPQTEFEKLERAQGRGPALTGESPAQVHATQRLMSGFTIDQLVAEYRALRTSVLHLWANRTRTANEFELNDMTRFNEAIDQALSESVARYASMERQARDIFIGILGHDIRTPLHAISIGAETLMRSEALDGRQLQLVSRIFNSSARINELVNNLLDFTRARIGMQLAPRPANIGLLAEQVAEEIRAAQPDRRIELHMAGELDGIWDSGRICQVLSNLLNNALQHGSSAHAVQLSLTGGAGDVTLAVHNRGEPIPATEIDHIFEPLRRYARIQRHERSHANLGLGLYIAREVVLAHGGTIAVSSTGDGTTFTVQLPRGSRLTAIPSDA